jgi:hypothetical protein
MSVLWFILGSKIAGRMGRNFFAKFVKALKGSNCRMDKIRAYSL